VGDSLVGRVSHYGSWHSRTPIGVSPCR